MESTPKHRSQSGKVMLLQAQTALKQRVQDKNDKKKKKDGRFVYRPSVTPQFPSCGATDVHPWMYTNIQGMTPR